MKQFSPAAERNRSFIFEALNPFTPTGAKVLEIASGTGQHAAYFLEQRPDLRYVATDADGLALASIKEWTEGRCEVLPLNVLDPNSWPQGESFDVVININMIHISPWSACQSLLAQVPTILKTGGLLAFYGPFIEDEVPLAPSNRDFDLSLRSRDPSWGLRALERVKSEASERGFTFLEKREMPANNLMVFFRRC